jgi:demethylmenaquinone methyltransferase/2-methoxy-6-polyprenyl-1,4-benzoquinol methylase
MTLPDEISPKSPVWSGEDLEANPHTAVDKARRIEAMFTSIARKYDLNNRLHSMWQDQVWRHRAVALAEVTETDDVVDVACGTGDLAMAFCKAGAHSVLGIDFTLAMLDIAVTKAEIAGLPIEYRQGDAMDLKLNDESADIVSVAFGIRNVQDSTKAFTEFYRILRPGGRVIVLEFSTPTNAMIRTLNNFYTNRVMPITATIIAGDTSGAYKYLPKSIETFTKPSELASELERVGFCDMELSPQTFGVCTIIRALKR